jgi:transcriptional regulator with XRE-family HTH domain
LFVVESIGERIKSLRQEQELTLAELAEKSKLSASHLSQVERDKSAPSLMTLASIAQALQVNLRDLFESEGDQIHIARATDGPEETGDTTPVMRLQLTIPNSSWKLEADRLTLYPEAPRLEFEPYPGEVLGFVLDGDLALVIDNEQIELETGDSIHYDANQPYHLRCSGDRPCSVIWCNSPPRYDKVTSYQTEVPDKDSHK